MLKWDSLQHSQKHRSRFWIVMRVEVETNKCSTLLVTVPTFELASTTSFNKCKATIVNYLVDSFFAMRTC